MEVEKNRKTGERGEQREEVRGGITEEYSTNIEYMIAATLICCRKIIIHENKTIGKDRIIKYQVLLGQNEVINWLKSTPSRYHPMRYPGEWKFPGGTCDPHDESLEMTAIREFQEEFLGIHCPYDYLQENIKLFNQKLTIPIQGRKYQMNNFIIYDDQNFWNDEEIAKVNLNLLTKKQQFHESLTNGNFWNLSLEEKFTLSPEVHELRWFDIDEAIDLMASAQSGEMFANDWQRDEFQKYGIYQRDPMYQTMMTLIELRQTFHQSTQTNLSI